MARAGDARDAAIRRELSFVKFDRAGDADDFSWKRGAFRNILTRLHAKIRIAAYIAHSTGKTHP